MSWFYTQLDSSWVRCINYKCRAEFIAADVKRKRKCPSCKMGNEHNKKMPNKYGLEIIINMDKKCYECGQSGAMKNSLCLACSYKGQP